MHGSKESWPRPHAERVLNAFSASSGHSNLSLPPRHSFVFFRHLAKARMLKPALPSRGLKRNVQRLVAARKCARRLGFKPFGGLPPANTAGATCCHVHWGPWGLFSNVQMLAGTGTCTRCSDPSGRMAQCQSLKGLLSGPRGLRRLKPVQSHVARRSKDLRSL